MFGNFNFQIYLRLMACAMVPVVLSGILYSVKRRTPFSKFRRLTQQILIGIVFGFAAIMGTEFGVDIGGATANARDAAPLCAGLLFGAPAGIVAGIIGGIHRWVAVAWGAGMYSRLACSLSTVLAGFYAGILRNYVFEKKRPTLPLAFITGAVMEIIHMTVLFLTHYSDAEKAMEIVEICTGPMVLCNGVSVMLSVLVVYLLSANLHQHEEHKKTISQCFQTPMFILIAFCYVLSTVFIFLILTYNAQNSVDVSLQLNIDDLKQEILDASDQSMIENTRSIAEALEENPNASLGFLSDQYAVSDIWIVDENGIVVRATDSNTGYDMASDQDLPEEEQQSCKFLVLLTDECDEYVQEYRSLAASPNTYRKLAGVKLSTGGFVQTGYNSALLRKHLRTDILDITANRRIGESGHIIIADSNQNIVSDLYGSTGETLKDLGIDIDEDTPSYTAFSATVDGVKSRCMMDTSEGFIIIAVIPEDEIFETRNSMFYLNSFMEILVFAMLFIQVFLIIKRVLLRDLRKINAGLEKITAGELDTRIDAYSNDEISVLSDGINNTVEALERYITEAEERMDKDLALAKNIQHSALPSVFPPYPERKDFDVFASMNTAKEVGGDFYDFYLLDKDHLAILIADVSGKGVPAAMFMMTAKTLIKSLAESGMPVEEVFTKANAKLCANNDAGMFVTAWMGIVDLRTGHVDFANAGHNPPLIYRKDKSFEYLKSRAGFVLAGMDGMKYKRQELQLDPGDRIFLYTDGVTEAINSENELFGEERLKKFLDMCDELDANDTVSSIVAEVMRYAGELEQFDDITILMLDYFGNGDDFKMEYREYPANDDSLPLAQDFITEGLENAGASMKTVMQVTVAFEEMFVNVAHYAYPDNPGNVVIGFGMDGGDAVIVIKDSGTPFNPFAKEDPDITLPAEERGIGGLGIFMTRKIMNAVDYEYRDGCNIVTMRKTI